MDPLGGLLTVTVAKLALFILTRKEVAHLMQDQRQMVQNLTEEVRNVERQFASCVVAPLIEGLRESYRDNDRVLQYLDHARDHTPDNIADFRERPPGRTDRLQDEI